MNRQAQIDTLALLIKEILLRSFTSSVDLGSGFYVRFGALFQEEPNGTARQITHVINEHGTVNITRDYNVLKQAIIENYLGVPNELGEWRLPEEVMANNRELRPHYFRAKLNAIAAQKTEQPRIPKI